MKPKEILMKGFNADKEDEKIIDLALKVQAKEYSKIIKAMADENERKFRELKELKEICNKFPVSLKKYLDTEKELVKLKWFETDRIKGVRFEITKEIFDDIDTEILFCANDDLGCEIIESHELTSIQDRIDKLKKKYTLKV